MAGIRIRGDFGDFAAVGGGYGAWYDAALDIARQVIPSGTVVGNAIGSTRPKGGSSQPVQLSYPPPTPGTSPSSESAGMPSWLMPALLIGGGLLVFMMLNPRGRRR